MRKAIAGYEGVYDIDELGNVRRIDTNTILKGFIGPDGYKRISLTVKGKSKLFLHHRLLAIAFIPNPNNYPCVNHKDENKSNNSLDNLEWCTYRYNLNYGTHNLRANENRKKAISQYSKDGLFIKNWKSVTDIHNELGYDMGHISSCCKGKRKSANGYCWKYTN